MIPSGNNKNKDITPTVNFVDNCSSKFKSKMREETVRSWTKRASETKTGIINFGKTYCNPLDL